MSEFRKDPVTGRWVIIASEREKGRASISMETIARDPSSAHSALGTKP